MKVTGGEVSAAITDAATLVVALHIHRQSKQIILTKTIKMAPLS